MGAPGLAGPPTTGPVQLATHEGGTTIVTLDADEDGVPEAVQALPALP